VKASFDVDRDESGTRRSGKRGKITRWLKYSGSPRAVSMEGESCGICGGDGRIGNSFGLTTRCPSCHGTGRKGDGASGMRDVTKTKASHHRPTNKAAAEAKPQWPVTFEGVRLATEVRDSALGPPEVKARLIREIIEYEETHGSCTKTFQKKIQKQVRPKQG
jgi:hypothetical protein